MILVDTSAWSLFLRKGGPADHPAVRKLSAVLVGDQDVVLTALILQEILQAFRSEATFKRLVDYLDPIPLLELRRADCVAAAALHRHCAGKGISASTVDCQIAALAIAYDCELLTTDQDFDYIARHSRLKLSDLST